MGGLDGIGDDAARERVVRLFKFLQAFNEKRNPIVCDVDQHVLRYPWQAIRECRWVEKAPFEDPPDDGQGNEDDEDDFLLRVTRPSLEPPPAPPAELTSWVRAGWDDPEREAQWDQVRDDPDRGELGLTGEESAALEEWRESRDAWAVRARENYRAQRLFEWLWRVREEMEREGDVLELVLGDGYLAWQNAGKTARHPLLLQRLSLEYEPKIPRFTVTDADRPTEVNASLLRAVEAPATASKELQSVAADYQLHPLGGRRTDEFLKHAAGVLSKDGEFLGLVEQPPTPGRAPRIARYPLLLLRRRALGFEIALDAIVQDLQSGAPVPDLLSALVGVHPPMGDDAVEFGDHDQGDEAEDVLLSKEANREQLDIARRLARYGGVLVQGPPGTGKTHTIANLIGHFLAEGKSVLVTSHTTKALRVLREKVVPELQPLCVSVLEGDAAGNAQLRDSATKIGERLTSASPDALRREARALQARRASTLNAIGAARQALLECVQSEYSALVVAGVEYQPRAAAELVHEGMEGDGWIPGPVAVDSPCPLSDEELRQLYATSALVSDGDLDHLAGPLPAIGDILEPAGFRELVSEIRASEAVAGYGLDLWDHAAANEQEISGLEGMAAELAGALQQVPAWMFEAFDDAVRQRPAIEAWQLLLQGTRSCLEAIEERRHARMTFGAKPSQGLYSAEGLKTIGEVIEHFERGGSLGGWRNLTHRSWKEVTERSSVLGRRPESIDEFRALRAVVRYSVEFEQLRLRWENLMLPAAIPGEPGEPDEAGLGRYERLFRQVIEDLPWQWWRFGEACGTLGLRLDALLADRAALEPGEWWTHANTVLRDDLPAVLAAHAARLRLRANRARIAQHVAHLRVLPAAADRAHPLGQLVGALADEDVEAYAAAHVRLAELLGKTNAAQRRDELLGRLASAAPDWAEAIRFRRGEAGLDAPPGSAAAAWRWKQLARQLDERSRQQPGPLIEQIADLREQLRELTANLVERLAWAAQAEKTRPDQRMALAGYVHLMKAIGKGTGRRVHKLRKQAREQMQLARPAVPVWIAPLGRVAETFVTSGQKFDLVIIDEASQSDVLGLIAWYIGKQVMVVGDDQQVTPSAVGERTDDIQSMIDSYLFDVPNSQLYSGQASVYQLGSTVMPGVVRLREHFRCLPEIISFSNQLSYAGEIVPLRDPTSARVMPAVVAERVRVRVSEGEANREEALHVASLVAACIEQPEYGADGNALTMGVIALKGTAQAVEIQTLLRRVIPSEEYERRRLLCGQPPHFQGDERDVIFLSMVDGPPEVPPHRLLTDTGEQFKKRYNVAASRARDQLWVVHSLDHRRDLKTDDLRWQLLDWAADPSALANRLTRATAKAESPFEREVIEALVRAGHAVQPQHAVGGFRIDIVVGDQSNRLAIECDGAAYHSTDEQIRQDLDRQALLERMGWRFYRIRGTEFYRDPRKAMERLNAYLEKLGIEPSAAAGARQSATDVPDPLLERVRTRAAELRKLWAEGQWTAYAGSAPPLPKDLDEEPVPTGPARTGSDSAVAEKSRRGDSTATAAGRTGPMPREHTVPLAQPSVTRGGSPRVVQPPLDGTVPDVDSLNEGNLVQYLKARGFRVEDKRPKGGALWCFGQPGEIMPVMRELQRRGLAFTYSANKGGWYRKP